LVDFLQALIFLTFDVNWQTYLLNASILNGVFAVLTYKLLLEFELDQKSSFFYTICVSILAYTSSGTPFVDHHSTFFSIISIYLLIFAIKKEKLIYWILIPFFLSFAFLSKQVPATYIFFSVVFLIAYNFIFRDENRITNRKIFLSLLFSSGIIVILFLLFFSILEINIQSFIDQYIHYPREIGQNRYLNLNYDFKKTIIDFKFIHLVFLFLIITNAYNLIK
jgi:4-amino-4-deoxy-L-arabinose transferase-like glycosyltransferase